MNEDLGLYTTTTNGADALTTTGTKVLDLFARAGAMRQASDAEIIRKFEEAYQEDNQLTTKLLFYIRDILLGMGERRVFRLILKRFAELNPIAVKANLANVPYYGRYDDLLVLLDTTLKDDVIAFYKETLMEDVKNMNAEEPITLLAKWLPSMSASNAEQKRRAHVIREGFGMEPVQYRKTLSALRKHLDVVEVKMSNNGWDNINYQSVPSYAMMRYRKAFERHDPKGYEAFLSSVERGEANIKAGTLFPYDIVEKILYQREDSRTLALQWDALPNYVEDNTDDILIMSDVSGSMTGRPMATSIGLGIYFAERNTGFYKNKFMTFSSNPSIVSLEGDTITEKIKFMRRAEWQMSTDLEKALLKILKDIQSQEIGKYNIPKALVIITDMQFNRCVRGIGDTFYEKIKRKYNEAGYELPNIVFWNVNSPTDSHQVSADAPCVQLASGQSAAIFKTVLSMIGKSPYQAMLETLNSERYERVVC